MWMIRACDLRHLEWSGRRRSSEARELPSMVVSGSHSAAVVVAATATATAAFLSEAIVISRSNVF